MNLILFDHGIDSRTEANATEFNPHDDETAVRLTRGERNVGHRQFVRV
jgi:hypothetical protein